MPQARFAAQTNIQEIVFQVNLKFYWLDLMETWHEIGLVPFNKYYEA